MENTHEQTPSPSEPRAAPDPAAEAKQAAWERYADASERSISSALCLPPGLYLFGFITRDAELAPIAYAGWIVGVLLWTQWIPTRVRKRSPPGDAPLATAWLGLGLLGLPLSVLVLAVAPEGHRAVFGFPVIFVWCGVFMLIANLFEAPTPSALRRRALDVGVVAYLGQALLAGGGSVALVTQEASLHPSLVAYAYPLALGCAALAVVLALVGLRLAGDAQAPPQPHWIAEARSTPDCAP